MKVCPPRAVAEIFLRQITNGTVCRSQIFQSQEGRKQLLSEGFGVISSLFHPPSPFALKEHELWNKSCTNSTQEKRSRMLCSSLSLGSLGDFAKMLNDISNSSLQAVLSNRYQSWPANHQTFRTRNTWISSLSIFWIIFKAKLIHQLPRSCEFGTVERHLGPKFWIRRLIGCNPITLESMWAIKFWAPGGLG